MLGSFMGRKWLGLGVLAVALFPTAARAAWINEIHYENGAIDIAEFVEVVMAPGENVANFSVKLYDGASGGVYATLPGASFIAGSTLSGYGVYWSGPLLGPNFIQDGPDGLALVSGGVVVSSGGVPQFLSYGGSFVATNGPANGLTSTDIGVFEPATNPPGQSLYLTGLAGSDYSDFTWTGPNLWSPGFINAQQDFVPEPAAVPEPASLILAALGAAVLLARDLLARNVVSDRRKQA